MSDKYKWHDLIKNPKDLPDTIGEDYLTVCVNGTYIVRTYGSDYGGIIRKGFLDCYGHEVKTHQRKAMQVVAWKEIEAFENEDE